MNPITTVRARMLANSVECTSLTRKIEDPTKVFEFCGSIDRYEVNYRTQRPVTLIYDAGIVGILMGLPQSSTIDSHADSLTLQDQDVLKKIKYIPQESQFKVSFESDENMYRILNNEFTQK